MALRRPAIFLAWLFLAIAVVMPTHADARAGGGSSFGSRGMRTYSAPPPTATAPRAAAPIDRSVTPPPSYGASQPGYASGAPLGGYGRGGFMSGLMGGFLGAGLFGMMFGGGFFGGGGGFGSLLGTFIQIALLIFVVRLVMGFFRSRSIEQQSYGGPVPMPGSYALLPNSGAAPGYKAPPASPDTVGITPSDFTAFEKLLGAIQSDWSRGDIAALRRHVTPEMLSYFAEELAANTSRGFQNRVEQVQLLQGDLSEAWNEGNLQYATVAMRYSLLDWNTDLASGRVVSGDPSRPTQATEVWTFMRSRGGEWLLSAIQQE